MTVTTDRPQQLADAAIAVIAGQGIRALTHRAVDAAAGVPVGTTSNHFRTRRDLLRGVLTRIAETNAARLNTAAARTGAVVVSPGSAVRTTTTTTELADREAAGRELADEVARFVDEQLTIRRDSTLARMACEIEVASDAGLREILHAGDLFPMLARAAVARLGVADPDQAAAGLLAVVEGLQYDRLVGVGSLNAAPAGSPAARAEVAAVVGTYVDGLLTR